jgi:hypothetical protein
MPGCLSPDVAALHPGYKLRGKQNTSAKLIVSAASGKIAQPSHAQRKVSDRAMMRGGCQ